MFLTAVVCDLLVLVAARRILYSGRRLALSEVASPSESSVSSDSRHSGNGKNESSTLFPKERSILKPRRHAHILSSMTKAESRTSGLDASESLQTNTLPSLNLSNSHIKSDRLGTPPSVSQLMQTNSSTNVLNNYSSAFNIASAAFKVNVWDGSLNAKGVLLLFVFFCLGCTTNACLGHFERKNMEHEEDDDYRCHDHTRERIGAKRNVCFSEDSMASADAGNELSEGSSHAPHRFGTRKLKTVLKKGKEKRGAEADDHYKPGDFIRGLFSKT